MFDVIVVGAGPAGTAAALRLSGVRALVLDAGDGPELSVPRGNFYEQKRDPAFNRRYVLGDHNEGLEGLLHHVVPKIKFPARRFVTRRPPAAPPPPASDTFEAATSFAKGGLANAWGGQLYRFDDAELAGLGLGPGALDAAYALLTREIGIAGQHDDLTPYYGTTDDLLPPVALDHLGRYVEDRYTRRRDWFHARGVRVGRPRLGVLTRPHQGRPAIDYGNQDFVSHDVGYLYTPRATLDRLIAAGAVAYEGGWHVDRFESHPDHVAVLATHRDGTTRRFQARRLLLAAGTLGTARLVLASHGDTDTRVPLLDNLLSYVPFVVPRFLGHPRSTESYFGQVNLFYSGPLAADPVMGTFYSISGLMHGDVQFDLPLPTGIAASVARHVLPALAVLHVWYAARGHPDNHLRLRPDGTLDAAYPERVSPAVEHHLIRTFRGQGLLSAPALCQFPKAGHSFHYAGTFPPAAVASGRYVTDPVGALLPGVHLVDGSVFGRLPAKNLTFTIMANAVRIADAVVAGLRT